MSSTNQGEIFLIRDGNLFRIGCSKNADSTLREIQQDRPNAVLLYKEPVNDMKGVEVSVQDTVQLKLELNKLKRNTKDWFDVEEDTYVKMVKEEFEIGTRPHKINT